MGEILKTIKNRFKLVLISRARGVIQYKFFLLTARRWLLVHVKCIFNTNFDFHFHFIIITFLHYIISLLKIFI
jgi:hypothetical protein